MRYVKRILGVFVFAVFMLMPKVALAEDYLAKFDALLNENGVLEINSVPPVDMETFFYFVNEYVGEATQGEVIFDYKTCNSDFTVCDAVWGYDFETESYSGSKKVSIIYNYDEEIKKVVDGYVNAIPKDVNNFEVKDMELVNWWVNSGEIDTLINYSGELKSYLSYKNFSIDARMGSNEPLYTYAEGFALFSYNGVPYNVRPHISVDAKHIIYIPETTGDSKEELIAAANKRIEEYVGNDKVTVTYGGQGTYELTLTYFDFEIAETEAQLKNATDQETYMSLKSRLDYLKENQQEFIDNMDPAQIVEDETLETAVGNYFFILTIGEKKYAFCVVKSDEDMVVPEYKTSDISTDVTITSTSSSIPLDTLIQVTKLTSGTDYEDLIELLNVTNSESFDLKLYSNTLQDYVTKLEDGTFEVRIPLSENMENKNLIVYYVDENDKIIEHEVKIKDGYAVFNTNHFSIYTLAEKMVASTTPEVNNPPTFDGITTYLLVGSISLIGIASIIYAFKKKFI